MRRPEVHHTEPRRSVGEPECKGVSPGVDGRMSREGRASGNSRLVGLCVLGQALRLLRNAVAPYRAPRGPGVWPRSCGASSVRDGPIPHASVAFSYRAKVSDKVVPAARVSVPRRNVAVRLKDCRMLSAIPSYLVSLPP